MDRVAQPDQLLHHLLVDLQPAGGVEQNHAVARTPAFLDPGTGDLHDVLRGAIGVDGNVELRAQRLELVDGGRAVDVGCDESRRPSLGLELAGQFRSRRRLARSLQADEHNDGRRDAVEVQPRPLLAEHGGELVVDDLDELLCRRDGLDRRNADGLLLNPLDELARELEADVGLEQHTPDFPKPFLDVGVGEHAATAELRKNVGDLFGKFVEHEPRSIAGPLRNNKCRLNFRYPARRRRALNPAPPSASEAEGSRGDP